LSAGGRTIEVARGSPAPHPAVSSLILKRASASRPSCEWSDDDFDVIADGVVVGPHHEGRSGADGTVWMWMLAFTRPSATKGRARLRWLLSRRAGDRDEHKQSLAG
jgi:hypothetical protein